MSAVGQPAGTVTLVFTDIEGSTRLLEELGTDGYRAALAEHRRIVLAEDFEDARLAFEAALDAAQHADYDDGVVMAQTHLADLTLYEGDSDQAVELLEASVGRARAIGCSAGETAGCVNPVTTRARPDDGRTEPLQSRVECCIVRRHWR